MRRHTAGSRASTKSIHEPARSLRRFASLLSTFAVVAGVPRQTSRQLSRESETFVVCVCFLVRFLARPTNHPRHAACASNDESKPVRPLFFVLEQIPLLEVLCNRTASILRLTRRAAVLKSKFREWRLK
jgi:hypothetical protein